MIDAERWYEYQKNYQKYGFDMKPRPEPELEPRRHRKRRVKKVAVPFGNGKKIAFSAVLVTGIIMIMLNTRSAITIFKLPPAFYKFIYVLLCLQNLI